MAKLEPSKCPHCGAPITVPPQIEQVACPYCGHTSSVQRGRPRHDGMQQGPVIHVEISQPAAKIPKWIGLVVVVPFVVGMASIAFGLLSKVSGNSVRKTVGLAALGSVSFGDYPFLFDVNADGTLDIIGKSGSGGEAAWIAAYDGRDGKELWRGADLTKDASDASAMRALAGDTLVSVDGLGKVQAYKAKTGQPAWAALLGETAKRICAGEDFVRITTSDKETHDFALSTGQKSTTTAERPCRSIGHSRSADGPGYRMIGWSDFKKYGLPSLHDIDGMSAHRALVPDDGKRAFLLGSRAKGTQVAMVAAVEGKKALWKMVVPGIDPLTTKVNVTTQIATVFKDRIVIPYDLKDSKGVRMAAFDTKTGTRLWDVAVHDNSQVQTGLVMTDTDVYYATWTGVYVLAADTGTLRFRIGREF